MPPLDQNTATDHGKTEGTSIGDSHSGLAQFRLMAFAPQGTQAGQPTSATDAQLAQGPGKDVANRLDGQLKLFAGTELLDPSANLVQFQKLIGDFENSSDRVQAMQVLGPAATKINMTLENDAMATYQAEQTEAANVPGRQTLDNELSAKAGNFFDAAQQLPGNGKLSVLQLVQWQEGETSDDHAQRVRDGLKNYPSLLPLFDAMQTVADKVDQSKTPRERALDQQHQQDLDEEKTIKAILNWAYIRAQIPDTAGGAGIATDDQPMDGKTGPASLYPDPNLTPGDTFPVTKEQVCTPGYAGSVRAVSVAEKKAVYAEYNIPYVPKNYEVDHFISLELGGSNDKKNLWPEPYDPRPGAHEKDRVENYLHAQVCNGSISLEEAQKEISTDWYAVYQQMQAGHLTGGPDPKEVQ